MRCLLTGRHCNLARGFAEYFAGYPGRQRRDSLLGGPYVTTIALHLGYGPQVQALQIQSIPPDPLDRRRCMSMGIVGKYNGVYRLRTRKDAPAYVHVPLVEPPAIEAAEVEIVDQQVGDEEEADPDSDHDEVRLLNYCVNSFSYY